MGEEKLSFGIRKSADHVLPCPTYIDGRFYSQPLSGIQRYADRIVHALDDLIVEGHLPASYNLVLPAGTTAPKLKSIRIIKSGVFRGHAWTQTNLAWVARDGALLSLAASGPILHKRQLVVIHDAAVFRHPEFYSRTYRLTHRVLNLLLARRACLGTVSRFSQRELAEVLRVPRERIAVLPNGAEHLRITPDLSVVDRLGLSGRPFFMVLGSLTKNKNLATAMRAIRRLEEGQARLVAVGSLDQAVFGHSLPPITPDVLLAGRLSDAEVAGLMQTAQALIFPSIYEGFGIPPLEAMVNGCPVIASTAPAIQEVCDNAADYFDAHDDARLAELMIANLRQASADRNLRIKAGHARAEIFSWRKTALEIADLAGQLCNGHPAQ